MKTLLLPALALLTCLPALAEPAAKERTLAHDKADRRIRQAFADIEKNIDLQFRNVYQHDPELKKQLADLKVLRERMEETLAKEVKKIQEQRLGDSAEGIDAAIPGYTKDYHLEEFRK